MYYVSLINTPNPKPKYGPGSSTTSVGGIIIGQNPLDV